MIIFNFNQITAPFLGKCLSTSRRISALQSFTMTSEQIIVWPCKVFLTCCVCLVILNLWWLDGADGHVAASTKINSIRIETETVPCVQWDFLNVQNPAPLSKEWALQASEELQFLHSSVLIYFCHPCAVGLRNFLIWEGRAIISFLAFLSNKFKAFVILTELSEFCWDN